MSLSINDCIKKVKEVHPDLYPIWYIEDKGKLLFALLKRGVSKEDSLVNLYVVDPDNGAVYGPIPTLSIYENKDLANKLQNPHIVPSEDQFPVKHGSQMDSFLMHYGIKGQKWGVRRFQNADGTLTPEGKERYLKSTSQADQQNLSFREKWRTREANNLEKAWEALDAEVKIDREKTKQTKSDGRIVDDVLWTIINPANAAFLAADGMMAVSAKMKLKKYMKNREENSEKDPKTGLYLKKDGQYSEKMDLEVVNPGFRDLTSNTKNNCMLCTTTYDMRKRGYDVTAQLDSEGYAFSDIKNWYPKAKVEKISRFNDNGIGIKQKEYIQKTIDTLKKQGDGARGNLMMLWPLGGGHSVYYEIKNGNLVIKDAQTAKTYDYEKNSFMKATPKPEALLNNAWGFSYARLDNIEPDIEKIIKECVR